jgi:hypothetical protein
LFSPLGRVLAADFLDGFLELRFVGHVQGQGRNAPIQVGQRLARTGIHLLGTSAQGFLDQCLSDTAIGPVTRTALSTNFMWSPMMYLEHPFFIR